MKFALLIAGIFFFIAAPAANASINMQRAMGMAMAKTRTECSKPRPNAVVCAGVIPIHRSDCTRTTHSATCNTFYALHLKYTKYYRDCSGFFLIVERKGVHRIVIKSFSCYAWYRLGSISASTSSLPTQREAERIFRRKVYRELHRRVTTKCTRKPRRFACTGTRGTFTVWGWVGVHRHAHLTGAIA